MAVEEHQAPIACSPASAVTRPEDLEDAACWPVTHIAALLQSRQVSSLELTKMYLERLHRYQPLLNCTVTFLDELALAEAAAADAEIAAGRYGPLNCRTAARTLFLRPYLAHFCPVFSRFFAVFFVLTPGFQKVAPKDRGPVP